jgi:hypothetical protein
MNLIRKRIKYLLEEIKTEKGYNLKTTKKNYCVINLLFDTDEFNTKCSSIGDFMKKLKNGKISYKNDEYFGRPKQNNREYFNDLIGDGGFYRFTYSFNFIEINIYLDLNREVDFPIDSEIIISRVSKIVNPLEYEIGFNDQLLLDKTFRDLTITDTGWNVFGDGFRHRTIV